MLNIDKSFSQGRNRNVWCWVQFIGSGEKEIEKLWAFPETFTSSSTTVPQMAIDPFVNEKRFPSKHWTEQGKVKSDVSFLILKAFKIQPSARERKLMSF